jgi:hypothetical protein
VDATVLLEIQETNSCNAVATPIETLLADPVRMLSATTSTPKARIAEVPTNQAMRATKGVGDSDMLFIVVQSVRGARYGVAEPWNIVVETQAIITTYHLDQGNRH